MKLIVSLIITCALFNKVYSLQCYECMGEQCTHEVTCPPAQICGSISEVTFIRERKRPTFQRRCVQPKECISGSFNSGYYRTGINIKCCATDLCNVETVPEYSNPYFNGKTCFTCSEKDCTSILRCQGDENNCVKRTAIAEGHIAMSKGCISSNLCHAAYNIFPIAQIDQMIYDCCEGDLCNRDLCNAAHSHAGLSLLLLLLPLACFSLFH